MFFFCFPDGSVNAADGLLFCFLLVVFIPIAKASDEVLTGMNDIEQNGEKTEFRFA